MEGGDAFPEVEGYMILMHTVSFRQGLEELNVDVAVGKGVWRVGIPGPTALNSFRLRTSSRRSRM